MSVPALSEDQSTYRLALALTVSLVALYVYYGLHSTGTYQDDDIAHFLIARYSWKHPSLFLDTWGRPAFTILYAPVAFFGLTAARIFSAALAGLTCVAAWRLARLYGVRWPWLAVLFTGIQAEFIRQAFGTLTELTFALVLCLSLIAYRERRFGVMAAAAGWLPLARYESLPILAVFLIILFRERRYWLMVLAVAPMLVWNASEALLLHQWQHVLFPIDHLFLGSAASLGSDYGSGPIWYYVARLPVAFGGTCFVFGLYGFLRMRWGLLHVVALLVVSVLSLTYWAIPSVMAGYLRFLAVLAPVAGVLGAAGAEHLATRAEARVVPVRMLMVAAAVALVGISLQVRRGYPAIAIDAAFAAFVALAMIIQPLSPSKAKALVSLSLVGAAILAIVRVRPFQLTEEQRLALDAATWYKARAREYTTVLAAHVWFAYGTGVDTFDSTSYQTLTPDRIDRAPSGALVLWDSHYSPRLTAHTPLGVLERDPRFQRVQSFVGRTAAFYFFVKSPATHTSIDLESRDPSESPRHVQPSGPYPRWSRALGVNWQP